MKLKFERYPAFGCFYVRGKIESDKLKLLQIGIETLLKGQEEPIILHLGHAELAPAEIALLAAFRKKMGIYKLPQYWIHPDRTLGEFKTFELAAGRQFTSKTKYIADRIILDDEVYLLNEKITTIQNDIGSLGGSEDSVKKIILENEILKTQKEVLEQSLAAQHARMAQQSLKPSDDKEIVTTTETAVAELITALGGVGVQL